MDKNITGRLIAELRKQKGFTQKELAEKLLHCAGNPERFSHHYLR